jgi:polysaccharide export outer membrane protein
VTQESNGDSMVAQVSVQSLVEARNPTENIVIQPFDVISIPRADVIYVVGNVKKSGSFDLNGKRSLSVVEALALAGGFDVRAASKHARVLRAPGVGKTVIAQNQRMIGNRQEIMVDLTKVLGGKAEDIHMQPNDILFVPNSTAKTVTSRSIEAALQIGMGLLIWR